MLSLWLKKCFCALDYHQNWASGLVAIFAKLFYLPISIALFDVFINIGLQDFALVDLHW